MDCTLAALIACFRLSTLYVDGGVAYQDAGMYHEVAREHLSTIVVDGEVRNFESRHAWQYDRPANPYGRLAIGYELHFGRLRWRLEASHVSSIASNEDRGINSLGIGAQWFPFGGRR